MKKLLLLSAFVLVSVFTIAQSDAESDSLYSLSLEELLNVTITTASKQEESITDAAAIVSVITQKEIEAYGAISLAELLDRTTNTYFSSGYTYRDNMLSIRGNVSANSNTNVLILIDGRPFRESLFNGLNASVYASFPLERIDRIEIIRGPGSILYGTCALTGVVNIITKSLDKTSPLSASFRYGSFNTLQGTLAAGKKIGKLELTAGANFWNTDGWEYKTVGEPLTFQNPMTGESMTINPNADSLDLYKKNFGLNVGAKVGNLKVSLNYLQSEQANMGAEAFWLNFLNSPGIDYNTEFSANIKRLMLDVGYEKQFSKNWQTTFNLTANTLDLNRKYDAFPNYNDNGNSLDNLLEVTNYIKPFENASLIVGGLINWQTGQYETYAKNGTEDVATSSVKNNNPLQVIDYDQVWWGAYVQGEYKLTERIKVLAGLQANKVTNIDLDVVPRVGSIISLNKNLGAKILYGQSFRSPSHYERDADNFPEIVNNPNLQPEKMGTFETQIYFTQKKFELFLTYYTSKQTDVIRQGSRLVSLADSVGAPELLISQYVNGGELNSWGMELEGKAYLTNTVFLNFSTSYQQSEDKDEQKDIFGMPQFMGKLGITYTSPFGLSASVFNSYFGEAKEIPLESGSYKINKEASGYNYLSAHVQYNLSDLFKIENKLIVGVYATNLLDKDVYYSEYNNRIINTLPGRSGRSVYANVTYRF